MNKVIPKAHLYVTGYSAYWDGYTFSCMDNILSEAQLVYYKTGYVDARKEDKGR